MRQFKYTLTLLWLHNDMKHSKKYDAPSCEGHENSSVTVLTTFAGTSHHWTPSKLLKRLADGNVPIEQWAACRKSYSHL